MLNRLFSEIRDFRTCQQQRFEEYTSRTATKSEVKEILDIRHSVLEEMEIKTIWQVRAQNKLDDFYARVNEIQFERHGCYRVFTQYKIVFSKEKIFNESC